MKHMKNSVQLIGNVGKTPVVQELQGGNLVARFVVATHEKTASAQGKRRITHWHNVVAWGSLAGYVGKHLDKGMPVALEGRLGNRSWTDSEGKSHFRSEVILNEIIVSGKRAAKLATVQE